MSKKMDYGMFIRSQYKTGDDMTVRFDECAEQARLAEKVAPRAFVIWPAVK